MAKIRFFLDTGALIALSGLEGSDLQDFKNRMEAGNSEISVTHVQVDESTKHMKFHEKVKEKYEKKVKDYQQKINKALGSLKNKGITVHLEDTKAFVIGVSRIGYTVLGGEEIGKLYGELRKEIDECERTKKGTSKPLLNIASDATIAVSSLNHDFFITCDRCLFDSWGNVISKNRMLEQQFKVPKVIYAKRSPKEVARKMLELLQC